MAFDSPITQPAKPGFFTLGLLNYAFYLLLIVVFVLAASPLDKVLILFSLLGSLLICYLAFIFRSLSLDGMRTAIIVGTISLGLGGFEFASYILFFFISSNLLGVIFRPSGPAPLIELVERRTAEQVWANSFWFVFFLMLFYITGYWALAIGSAAAIATATSDTWATIFGSTSKKPQVKLIHPFQDVPKGTDGGISLRGTLGGLAGAAAVAALVWWHQGAWGGISAIAVFISGFSGCLLDSYFGAHFQYKSEKLTLAGFTISPGNHLVNFLAVGIGSLFGIILYTIFLYALV